MIKLQGYAWASQAAMDFQIPSQASSQGIVKSPSLILLCKWPCFSRLAQAVKNRKNTMFPVFLSVFIRAFDSFAPAHLALRANLRLLYLAPAPVLGCGSKVFFLFVSISVIGG
jgi:hypothetical protein